VSFCSQWWYARISVCLAYYRPLMAYHWCKAASEAMARARGPFIFVDAPAYLAQWEDCDEMLVIRPD